MKKLNLVPTFLSVLFISQLSLAATTKTTKTTTATPKKTSGVGEAVKTEPTPATAAKGGISFPLKSGSVEFFSMATPSHLKIHGESTEVTGELLKAGTQITGELKIPLESFKTGMGKRDDHLKERVFETEKFKTATLKITQLTVPAGSGEFKDLAFKGSLSLHGVDKDVSGTSTVTVTDQTVKFVAHFETKVTDYQMKLPEFMGMTVLDEVKIDARGEGQAILQ